MTDDEIEQAKAALEFVKDELIKLRAGKNYGQAHMDKLYEIRRILAMTHEGRAWLNSEHPYVKSRF